jgi:alkylated DNA repair dioxygenase AlkB
MTSFRETIVHHDGDVVLYRHFFGDQRSDRYLTTLLTEITWRQDQIRIFDRLIPLPRLTAWYGNPGQVYTYSGIQMNPRPWTPTLLDIKSRIEALAEVEFNSVLLNLYRCGRDSVAWHSDDEPELGQNPIIGSVSFGAPRRFSFKHKFDKTQKPIQVELPHGSFLLMRGATQHYWVHQIPKTKKPISQRINLTFRTIKTPNETAKPQKI